MCENRIKAVPYSISFLQHGHSFRILAVMTTDQYQAGNVDSQLNLTNPPRRETLELYKGYTAILQIETNNPGVWFFHCHLEWHLEERLAAPLIEHQELLKNITIPQD